MESIEMIIIQRTELLQETFKLVIEKCNPVYRHTSSFGDEIYNANIFQELLDKEINGQYTYPVRQQLISLSAQVVDFQTLRFFAKYFF